MEKDKNLVIRVSSEFKGQIEALAKQHGLSVSAYITMLLTREINKKDN